MKTSGLFLIIIFLLFSEIIFSQTVSQQYAEKIAQKVFQEISGKKHFCFDSEIIKSEKDNQPVIYIFNEEKAGFIIISGDKRVYPLLAFSANNSVITNKQNWSPSFSAWLQMYCEQIELIREENVVPEKEISEKWELLEKGEKLNMNSSKNVAPLLSTTWNQGCGYNSLCPTASGGPCGRAHTGCVATAMAQVMRYFGYPTSGDGSQCYNTTNYGELCADFEHTVYNYSTMTNSSGNSEVAKLMYHCGVAVFMNYSPSGSGANSNSVVTAWKKFFGYKNHLLINKNNFVESDWIRVIRNEIDNNRPIYYAGFSASSGHAFVFDGYQGTDHFHINWGWGGSYDGYFYVTNLKPGGTSFSNNQQAIVGTIPAHLFTGLNIASAINLNCATPVSGDISTGNDYINYYKNTYPQAVGKELIYTFTTTFSGRIRIKITNNVGGDVNVFLLSYPHQDSLIAYGTNNLIVDNTLPKNYYIAVEGVYGKQPTFNIEVKCPSIEADLFFTQTFVNNEFIQSLLNNVILTSTIKNIGNTNTGTTEIKYYLSSDNLFDGSDIYLGNDVVSPINAGQSINISTNLTMPAGLISGNYYIIFNLDPDNTVVESDDENFAFCSVIVPNQGIMNCSSAISLQDGVWHYGNTLANGNSIISNYWSSTNMTGPEVIHSFTATYNGFAEITLTEKEVGEIRAIVLPICNENSSLTNIWFNNITDTIGKADFFVTANTVYYVIVDGLKGVYGNYGIKVNLPNECPNMDLQISGKTNLCEGDYFPSLRSKFGASNYQWFKDELPIPDATDFWLSPTSAGVYYLEITENGCTSQSENVDIQMSFPPDTAQIANNGILDFCYGDNVELFINNTVTYPYNWALNGELIEGATNSTFVAQQTGYYSVVTKNGSCSVFSNSIKVSTIKLPADISEKTPFPSENLKFYYTFESDNSDFSGNNNSFNCWSYLPDNDRFGNFWQARYFPAGNVFGYTSKKDEIPSQFTISLWFKTNTTEGGVLAGFFDNPWNLSQMEALLYMSNNGKLHFYISNGGAPVELVSASSYNNNQWNLVTFQYNGNMKMIVNNGAEILINSNSITKQTFNGYWVFAGTNLPANVNDMPSSKYFVGSIDDIMAVYETNNYIDKYNFTLPELGLQLLSETQNCASADIELKILNSELNVEYKLWNKTFSQWFSSGVSGNYGDILITSNQSITETCEFKIFAKNTVSNCEKFLDTTILISVNPIELPEISINSSTTTSICEGTEVSFSSEIRHAGTNPQFEWYVNNVAQNNNSPEFIINPNAGIYNIYAKVSTNNPCAIVSFANSDVISFNALQNLTPEIQINNLTTLPLCEGSQAIFEANPQNGGNTPIYQWFVNNSPVGENEIEFTYYPQNNDHIYVQMTASLMCTSENPVSSDTILISVNSEFSILQQPMSTEICENQNYTLFIETTDENISYQWFKNDEEIIGANNSTYQLINANIENSGNYYCRLIGICNQILSNIASINIFEEPIADFDFQIDIFDVMFTNISQNANSYSWDFGDGNTSTEENPTHTYTNSGNYTVILTASNGICEKEFSKEVSITVNISNNSQDNIAIYPNPTTGKFIVKGEKLKVKNLVVTDIAGKIVNCKFSNYDFILEVDFLEFNSGIYFLKIETENQNYTRKVVKLSNSF